jgi:predicted TIM-barrel fold metal-dependent hydrolase
MSAGGEVMATLPYTLYDADNHYYEPSDCFTRHIDPGFRDRAVRIVTDAGGVEQVFIGERPFTFLADPFRDRWVKPGALREMLRNMSSGDFKESSAVEPLQPAYRDRDARLALMDEQGVEACLVLPTVGVCVEHFMKDDVPLTYANLRAFNRWLEDDWGFAYRNRIFAPPLLSLLDLDLAIAELDDVLARGARVVHLRPGPHAGRSPADPYFDPFWARIQEAGVAVAFHIAESGYNELFSVAWGETANPQSHHQSAFQWTCFYGDRPIMETVAALILHNLFGRFPGINVLSLENGSLWVPYLLKALDKMKGMGRNGPWIGGYVEGRPSDIFRRHVFVSPYHEEDLVALTNLIGAEHVLFGSDFPHAEGMAEPAEFADHLVGLDDGSIRRIMRENTRELLGC